ncbi:MULTISPECIES: CHAT domain-containing protein [unclassified Microcoleus]|uniref:CHAT domain-containing protein n=1 Tax=unclassified Microcoleus TaxID=2642155 RepID=UPI0040408ADE
MNYTDLEVTSIAPKFAIRQILPGNEASKRNLLEKYLDRLENAHCAHFSCHGSFNPDDPLKSFLILSGDIISGDSPSRGAPRRMNQIATWNGGKAKPPILTIV